MSQIKDTLQECMCLAGAIYKYDEKVKSGTKISNLNIDDIISCDYNAQVIHCGTNSRDIEFAVVLDKHRKRIYVIFRGSESLMDWYHDFVVSKYTLVEGKKIRIHKGMYLQLHEDNVFAIIKQTILDLLEEEEYKEYDVYVTGHSLGGGLSTLFSYLLAKQEKGINVTCISFASPRVGNIYFARDFNHLQNVMHYRCFNSHDIVAYVPNYRYYHCGIRVKLYKDNIQILRPLKDIDSPSFWRWWSISQHKCMEYCKRLKNNEVTKNDYDLRT